MKSVLRLRVPGAGLDVATVTAHAGEPCEGDGGVAAMVVDEADQASGELGVAA